IAGIRPRQHHQHVTTAAQGFEYPPTQAAVSATRCIRTDASRARREPRGRHMTIRTAITIASVAGTVAALAVIGPVRAGGDKVAFPEHHAAGVLVTTVDRADNKQFREFYVSAAALDAAKKGEPLPNGTVITMLQYAAKLDAQGNPEKDANGRFIKGNLIGYAVMEKRAGWGAEYPDNVRNGEWESQAFKPDKSVNTGANLSACFNCHKPLDKQDFVYLYDKMKAAAK